MSEEITETDFLRQLTEGDYKIYFETTCEEQKKNINNTKEQIKQLFNDKQTLDLETILDLKNFLKNVFQKDPTRKLLSKKIKLSNNLKYNIHELFFINSVYLFLRALKMDHPLLKEPLNYINYMIHLNPHFNKYNVEIKLEDGKHVYYYNPGGPNPDRDENFASIIHNILYYNGNDDDMKRAKDYMIMYSDFFENAAKYRQGGKKSRKSRKFKKSRKKSKKSRMGRLPHRKSKRHSRR